MNKKKAGKASGNTKPEPGSKASLELIAAGDPDRTHTQAAKRVLAKRAARNSRSPIIPMKGDDIPPVQRGTRLGKGKPNKIVSETPLPTDASADNIDESHRLVRDRQADVIIIMNSRAFDYFGYFDINDDGDRRLDAQVRSDFAPFGAKDRDIEYHPRAAGQDRAAWVAYSRKSQRGKKQDDSAG